MIAKVLRPHSQNLAVRTLAQVVEAIGVRDVTRPVVSLLKLLDTVCLQIY
jgi:hypothetical protein